MSNGINKLPVTNNLQPNSVAALPGFFANVMGCVFGSLPGNMKQG
jgi:hypothetical protein